MGELKEALGVVKTLMTRNHELDDALMSGVATALCAEFIEALKYLDGAEPYSEPCYGHLADSIIRELGVPLVTGDIPGVAVILGSAPTAQEGVDLIKSYQKQGILVTLVGGIIDQATELGLKMGYNVRIVPLGKDVTSVIHVVSVAIRPALIFGNVTPGDAGALLTYTKDRVPAFVNAFKPIDDVILAAGAGAIKLGFPVISNEDENIVEVPGALIACPDVADFNKVSLEARGIKIKITDIDIPVAFASAFEGEIIRRKDMQVEFDGSRVDCAELVQTKNMDEVEDHKITVVGPEVDTFEEGSKHSLAYVVEVAGKKMRLTLNRLSNVNSTITLTVLREFITPARGICSVSESAKMHSMPDSVQNILVKCFMHRSKMNLKQLLINVRLQFTQILQNVPESVMSCNPNI